MTRSRHDNRKYAELDARRELVARLYLQGRTQRSIAIELGISQSSVGLDLKRVRERWRAEAADKYETWLLEQLAKLDAIEQEAWAGWERSQQNSVTITNGPKGATTSTRNQAGDPRFLDMALSVIERRCRLLGFDLTDDTLQAVRQAAAAAALEADSNKEAKEVRDQLGDILNTLANRAREMEANTIDATPNCNGSLPYVRS